MTKEYRSRAMASIHKTAEGLHAAGVMDKQTMRKFDEVSFSTVDLTEDKVRAVAGARMDPCHDHLDAMLEE